MWADDIKAAISSEQSLAGISRRIKDAGLDVAELCFLGLHDKVAGGDFPRVLGQTEEICRMAQILDCGVVVAVPAMTQDSADVTPEHFHHICKVAATYGVRIGLEFPATACKVNNLAAAWQLVEEARSDNAGLVIDIFHFFLSNSNVEDLARIPAEKILLVHVSDAMDVPAEKLRTYHDYRTFPGQGVIDYDPVFHELRHKDYQGAFSLEIWNQELLRSEAREVARKGYASLNSLVQRERTARKPG